MIEYFKKTGKKNRLSEIEKSYFESQLGNEYKIKEQIGTSGARTSVYLVHNVKNESFVLKMANDCKDNDWVILQKESYDIRDLILKNYTGNVFIPKVITMGNNYILEQYAGIEFTEEVYETLSNDQKESVSREIAKFLNYLHQKQFINKISELQQCLEPKLRDVFQYFSSILNEDDKKEMANKIENFENRDLSDEITAMTHGDLRSQNVLYNSLTDQISIIDFESIRTRNIYHDFVPFAAGSFGMSYDFLKRIVINYNNLEKEYSLSIDLKKVKFFVN